MIDATTNIDLDAMAGMDPEDQLDALLTVADDERLAYCEQCGAFVPHGESVSSVDGEGRICEACWETEAASYRAGMDAIELTIRYGRSDAPKRDATWRDRDDGGPAF